VDQLLLYLLAWTSLPRFLVIFPFGSVAKFRTTFFAWASKIKALLYERSQKLQNKEINISTQYDFITHFSSYMFKKEGPTFPEGLSNLKNILGFILAGRDTTAGTLTYSLILLSLYPEIQNKLYQEVVNITGYNYPRLEDYPRFLYAQYILKETLRHYPPAPSTLRRAYHDVKLAVPIGKYQKLNKNRKEEKNVEEEEKSTDIIIPKGTDVIIDLVSVQRNPLYWLKPNEFIPERFDPKNKIKLNMKTTSKNEKIEEDQEKMAHEDCTPDNELPYDRYAFLAYSEGNRACIGRKFAEIEIVYCLCFIIQQYSIHLSPKFTKEQALETHHAVSLRPKHPIELIFRKRENAHLFQN